ncbi:CLUMA_CG010679, isoform A, partial [Clunio marinus]
MGCMILQNTVTLYAIVSFNFIIGYAFLVVTALQIFFPNLLGTVLIVAGDNYYNHLCNISWHMLSVSDQKSVLLLLVSAINPKKITAGLAVLQLQTFIEIYKSIY